MVCLYLLCCLAKPRIVAGHLRTHLDIPLLADRCIPFDAGGTYGMKGIPAKDIAAAGKNDATAANTKYTIDNTNWHPYVEIEMAVQPGVGMPPEIKTYKWATMNIGANSETEAGKYFAWGDIVGQTPSSSTFSPGFSWTTCPFQTAVATDWPNAKFNKYVPASQTSYLAEGFAGDNKEILDLADDAAYANWGGSWRMPIKWEFIALISVKEWDSTNGGFKFGTFPNQIFIPLTGFGDGTDFKQAEDCGRYWSSSVSLDYPFHALSLEFYWDDDWFNGYTGNYRYLGYAVRALSE